MFELAECKRFNPTGYIKIQGFDPTLGTESCVNHLLHIDIDQKRTFRG